MKQLIVFIRKEFHHVFRDRKTLLMLFGLPIVQIILFGFALTNEIKNSTIVIIDNSRDPASQRISEQIEASRYFQVEKKLYHQNELEAAFKTGKIKLAIVFPNHFQKDLLHLNQAQIQVIGDASDPNTANTLSNYVSAIIQDYQMELTGNTTLPYSIHTEMRMLYNPELKGVHNFVPGVMALVLMLVCVMMTSVSIVREKERGTMEILLVSPFKPFLVIVSKAIPYLLISLVNVSVIVLLSVTLLDMPMNGSLILLFLESGLLIVTALSLGLLISTVTDSQQSAMLISMMGMMLPTTFFSGFMFPLENMPLPLQLISNLVPAKWFYIIVKGIMIKGIGLESLWRETLVLMGMTIFFLALSFRKFKIRLA